MFLSFRKDLKFKARQNRNKPTKAEVKICYEILSNKKLGYRFLRQKPISNFIADFYCSSLKLVIEIDGDFHSEQENYDNNRTAELNNLGLKVIRYCNKDMINNIEGIYHDLQKQIEIREKELEIN